MRGVPARAARDRLRAPGRDGRPQDGRGAGDDRGQVLARVEIQVVEDPEALAQRRGEHARPRRRAHHGEGPQRDPDGAGVEALVHHEVDREVLHGRVEQLLDHARQPVDLVDEEHVLLGEVGEDAHEVRAALEGRAGGGDDVRLHLVGHDGGQRGLAESRRAREQHVIERLPAPPRRLDRHAQALDRRALSHVLGEALRPELPLDLRLLRQGDAAHDAGLVGHAPSTVPRPRQAFRPPR